MAKKTECYGENEHDCARNVRRSPWVSGLPANDGDEDRKRGCRERHAAGIDADAADPFFEVVAVRFENKPLIAEKRERDSDQV